MNSNIKTNPSNKLRESRVHPILAPHVGQWMSVSFAIKVSYILNEVTHKDRREIIKQQPETIKTKKLQRKNSK